MTSNKLVSYVRQQGYPFAVIHAAEKTETVQNENITFIKLKRSPASIPMDEGLKYDPFFQRHVRYVRRELEKFRPDVLHITGLNDVSILGAYLAWQMEIPMIGSWHTNLHEYASRRLSRHLKFINKSRRNDFTNFLERKILDGATLYYKMPQVILAPNRELVETLAKSTGRKVLLMLRGVDTDFFSPEKRTVNDGILRLGFVGRLRAEKNLRLLENLEKKLLQAGKSNFKFLIVGEGNEREFLEQNMKTAEFTGFLNGEDLAQAYANMDIFIFPSETDAFGNVIQEANASGVPCIVTNQGGPKFLVEQDKTGFIAKDLDDFVKYSIELLENPSKLAKMKKAAREFALTRSWSSVFEKVYAAYSEAKIIWTENRRKKEEKKRKIAKKSNDQRNYI